MIIISPKKFVIEGHGMKTTIGSLNIQSSFYGRIFRVTILTFVKLLFNPVFWFNNFSQTLNLQGFQDTLFSFV